MKKFLYTLVLVTGFISVTAQNIEGSFFLLNQVGSNNSKIRAKSSTEIVSFSNGTTSGMFTFLKDADSMIYATLPYYLEVNDFVVLDSCIFFCGKNTIDSCGYIGILDVNFSTMSIGGYKFLNIDKTVELSRMVAYNENNFSGKYGTVAIGKPRDTSYNTCIIDLNNYRNNGWDCNIGYTLNDYITDISLMWDGAVGEILTIGQSVVSNQNSNNSLQSTISYIPKMYIRNYKRLNVLGSGMEDEVIEFGYPNMIMSPSTPFKVLKVDNSTIVVSTMGNRPLSLRLGGIEIKKIDLNNLEINNIQFIDNTPGTFKEMTYFPNENKLGVLKMNTNNIDEIFLFDMGQTTNYASSKIYRNNLSLNSIFSYDGIHFLATGTDDRLLNPCLSLIQSNVNNFSTNECINSSNVQVLSDDEVKYPNDIFTDILYKEPYNVDFEIEFAIIEKTAVNLKCLNYYK